MELNITSDDVNRMVADAVLKSAIGDEVKKAVAKAVVDLGRGWDNPIETVIKSHIAAIVRDVLQDEHGAAIRQRVAEALKTKLTDDFISRVCDAATEKYMR